jgi:hypothetical protein
MANSNLQNDGVGKYFDVRRPGKSPAEPSSRPLIVGHKPTVQDESIGGASLPINHAASKQYLMNSSGRVNIQRADPVDARPPLDTAELEMHNNKQVAAPMAQPASDPSLAPTEAAQPKAPDTPVPATLSKKEALNVGAVATEATVGKAGELTALEKEASAEEISYDVVVSKHKKHASAWFVVLNIIMLLILLVAAADILLDTNVIKLTGIPHTDFF